MASLVLSQVQLETELMRPEAAAAELGAAKERLEQVR